MHFGSDDLEALHDRLVAAGVPRGDIRPYQRNVDTETGQQLMRALAFGFPPEANPEALIQMCQHLTPELVFQNRYQQHDNGAVGVVEITVCSDDPASFAGSYARYTGHDHTKDDYVYTVDLGKSRVRVVAPETLPALIPGALPPAMPSLVGFTVTVTDLDATRALLTNRAVPLRNLGDIVLVDAPHAAGATVSFIAA